MALSPNIGSLTSGSGIDVQGTVDQLMSLEKAPLTMIKQQQQDLSTETSVLNDIKSRLQSLETSIQSLEDYTGSLTARCATSSQLSSVTATATSAATISQHQISIDRLVSRSSWYSNPFIPNKTFSAGSFSLQLGTSQPVLINVAVGASLQNVANTINAKNAGITANVISDANGSRLTLISRDTGASNEIAVSSDSVGMGFQESASAKNAALTVDGGQINSASNSISTVIPRCDTQSGKPYYWDCDP